MNWKDRRIFSGQERGILSGMTPVEMTHGGMTPYPQEYQTGGMVYRPNRPGPVHPVLPGPVLPELDLSQHNHPQLHSHEEGLQLMQTGGLVGTELFEEGDEDVNDALNTMATITNPEVPDMPDMPGMPDMPVGPGPSTDVETEPTTDMEYETTVMQLKEKFQNDIRSYVAQAGTTDLEKYLQSMNVAYKNKLNEIKQQYNVTEFFPEEELLTENFVMELTEPSAIPGMKNGGEVLDTQEKLDKFFGPNAYSLKEWQAIGNQEMRELFKRRYNILKFQDKASGTSGSTDAPIDRSVLDALMEQRRKAAAETGEAARRNYASTSSSLLHNYDAGSAGRVAQAEAVDKAITGDIATELGLLSAQARGSKTTSGDLDFPADSLNQMLLKEIKQEQDETEFKNKGWETYRKKMLEATDNEYHIGDALPAYMAEFQEPPPYLTAFSKNRLVDPKHYGKDETTKVPKKTAKQNESFKDFYALKMNQWKKGQYNAQKEGIYAEYYIDPNSKNQDIAKRKMERNFVKDIIVAEWVKFDMSP